MAATTEPPAAASPGRTAAGTSPMMAQWHEAKAAHPDCLLFFRMGDFYELFFDDAVAAAAALDIALTKRGSHNGVPVPMAGVPVHAAEQYLPRLIKAGHRVAVCEQMEDPAAARQRGAKSIVRRAIVRVVTPGTLTEDALLDAKRHNYLAALAEAGGAYALAWLDVSTGEVWWQPLPDIGPAPLAAALARIAPGELLVAERLAARPELEPVWRESGTSLTILPASRFDSVNAERRLKAVWGVAELAGFGDPGRAEIAAAGALVDYVELTQVDRMPRLARPQRLPAPGASGAVMAIDAATRRNLELTETLAGARQGSLLATIDRTVTSGGGRLLARHLTAPLTDTAAIATRLDAVAHFVAEPAPREGLRDEMRATPDIERALSRLSLGRGGPRDLAAMRDGLAATARLKGLLGASDALAERLASAAEGLGTHDALVDRLERSLAAELPLQARDGGFIAPGYAAELDKQRQLRDESRRLIAGLQSDYGAAVGVPALKIRHNKVLGYFIEVTATHADRLLGEVGKEAGFRHRQTMANAVRFTTDALADLEDRIARAADRATAIELELFDDLAGDVLARAGEIAAAARAVAELDVASAHAALAVERDYCRPVVDASRDFLVDGGRHPVVEAALAGDDARFIANDCDLSAGDTNEARRLWLLTGPNMAGKSTFLRQNALIAVLAQIGAYVPARAARIGVVDRLFSRVGAADDLARGRSTFMVEMVETATILNQAGAQSLVILDEIGRGTATFDGLSIAWATVEHLHDVNRCRTLFATHFHELTSLAARLGHLACHAMRVKEWQGDVVFLHEVGPGTADRSYGIHVARLAGLPDAVVGRAQEVLGELERGEQAGALARLADDLPLFQASRPTAGPSEKADPSAVETLLGETLPDELTPREALELLYRLRALIDA